MAWKGRKEDRLFNIWDRTDLHRALHELWQCWHEKDPRTVWAKNKLEMLGLTVDEGYEVVYKRWRWLEDAPGNKLQDDPCSG